MYVKDMCYYEGHIKSKLEQVREVRERVIEEVQLELRSEERIGPTQVEKEAGESFPVRGNCLWQRLAW